MSHAVWLYHHFGVSFRDAEDLLAPRGLTVSYEAIRQWCLTSGSAYARRYTDSIFVDPEDICLSPPRQFIG